MQERKVDLKYIYFLFFLYLFVFSDWLAIYFPIVSNWDEIFALIAVPIWIINFTQNGFKISIARGGYGIWVFGYLFFSAISNVVSQNQTIIPILSDLLVNLKFWFSIYIGYHYFGKMNQETSDYKISAHIKFIVVVFIILAAVDRIHPIFESDVRYGIRVLKLFYSIHTVFASVCAVLLSILYITAKRGRTLSIYCVLLLLLMCATLRSKAFGGALLFIIIVFWFQYKKEKMKIWQIILLGLMGLFVGWSQIQFYFFSSISDGAARAVLLRNTINLVKDYFPFGVGFAGYGSYFSGVYYSKIYQKYSLANIYGLTQNHPVFVADSFWPMVFGQAGILGGACFVIALIKLFKKTQSVVKAKTSIAIVATYILAQLTINSMAESSFTNALVVGYGCILGICFARGENYEFN